MTYFGRIHLKRRRRSAQQQRLDRLRKTNASQASTLQPNGAEAGRGEVDVTDGVVPVQESDTAAGGDSPDDPAGRSGPLHRETLRQRIQLRPVDRSLRPHQAALPRSEVEYASRTH